MMCIDEAGGILMSKATIVLEMIKLLEKLKKIEPKG